MPKASEEKKGATVYKRVLEEKQKDKSQAKAEMYKTRVMQAD